MPLNVTTARNAKPGRHSDGKGLYLLVGPNGSKSWVLRVMYRGIRRDYGLGSFSPDPIDSPLPIIRRKTLSLAEAREKARLGRELAKAGINPSKEWKAEQEETPTFEQAAREYHEQVAKSWRNGKHTAQWLTTLELYAFPELGKLTVDEIDAPAIQRVLLPIWLTKGETARRVKQRIGVVLDYAHGKGWRDRETPMRALNQLLRGIKQPKKGNFAAIPYKDLPALVSTLRESEETVGRMALLFSILTVPRSGELRKATWSEMHMDEAEWHLEPDNTKTGRFHIIPLVPAAIDILKRLQAMFRHGPDDLVFPGLKRGKPMSDATIAKAFRVAGGGDYTVHGLRSTFSDWAAETGFNDAWAEAALSHKNPDKVVAAYKRTTFFDQRRDKLMPAWASFVLDDSSNVVQLVKASA